VKAAGAEGEDFCACGGDADGVLELRGQFPVACDGCPAVRQDLDRRFAEIDHRLDGEEHALSQLFAFARIAVMQDVRAVVEELAETVAAKVFDNRAALRFGVSLYRVADIPNGCARFDDVDGHHQAIIGNIDEAFGFAANLANWIHARRVTVPAIHDGGDVDIDDVAFFQRFVARDAVADDVID